MDTDNEVVKNTTPEDIENITPEVVEDTKKEETPEDIGFKYIKDYILEAINAMKNDKIKIFEINNFTSKKWFKIINKISMQLVDVEEKSVQNPIGYCYSIILNEI